MGLKNEDRHARIPSNVKAVKELLAIVFALVNYSRAKKELLAIILALEKFRSYFLGSHNLY